MAGLEEVGQAAEGAEAVLLGGGEAAVQGLQVAELAPVGAVGVVEALLGVGVVGVGAGLAGGGVHL